MRIGIPKEIKPLEGRVALIPEACGDLVRDGHEVLVGEGAGVASGFPDAAYAAVGARVVTQPQDLYAAADLVVKVKEPWGEEPDWLRPGQRLFSFLHLAADPALVQRLLASGVTALAFETLEHRGGLPILAPMSEIAGRLAVQIGARLLHAPEGGKGLLLGGLAAALGARVTVFDLDADKLRLMDQVGPQVTSLYPYRDSLDRAVREADLLIGAVLIPGARAPHLVSRDQVAAMGAGSVVVDIAVDQGGCIETTRPTTYAAPTYLAEGVIHFGVTNMPGAVPRTASRALCASLFPWVLRLARADWPADPALAGAVNVDRGRLVLPALRQA
ncbi:MAG TPA: alanine dehydrogenase [Chromatiaceae bacterium]|nr:alanine dehydrogenase [Chromatiaceae bacterium]